MMTNFNAYDHEFMSRAIRLAKQGLTTTQPNPRVGCVIVKDNQIIGEGWHKKAGEAHAEINALLKAGQEAQGATAYVTLEPCSHTGKTPPCANALIEAGIMRVVAAMQDPHSKVAGQGFKILQDAGIAVEVGLLEEQAIQLNPGFIKRMQQSLPFVRIKMAMSVDGRTAMASGESKWITSEAARNDVQHWRAQSCAILTGIRTVLADDPSLTVRNATHAAAKQPLRVILDSELQIPLDAKLLQQSGEVLIFTQHKNAAKIAELEKMGVKIKCVGNSEQGLNLEQVLQHLAGLEINEVMVEAGATVAGSFVATGLVDELVIYMAPTLMGNNARGLFNLPLIDNMNQKLALKIKDLRQFGDDIRIVASLA